MTNCLATLTVLLLARGADACWLRHRPECPQVCLPPCPATCFLPLEPCVEVWVDAPLSVPALVAAGGGGAAIFLPATPLGFGPQAFPGGFFDGLPFGPGGGFGGFPDFGPPPHPFPPGPPPVVPPATPASPPQVPGPGGVVLTLAALPFARLLRKP